MFNEEFVISRKNVIVGAGVGLSAIALSACTTYGKTPATPVAPPPVGGTPEGLAKTADVPVGSGVIVGDIVLTQPSPGVFKGFSAVCTHAGCSVAKIANGTIDCPCHGSKFNLDGTVAKGPASRSLESKPISVQGDSIILG
jgi:Rieske Fe-S protein